MVTPSMLAKGPYGAPAVARRDQTGSQAPGLATVLREETQGLHRQAERSGIFQELLKGSASRDGYALLLRNLLPAYRELERGLERHRHTPAVGRFALPALYRTDALEHDVRQIQGARWQQKLPLLKEAALYADRIAAVTKHSPPLLVGHAYVRYLGDLSGGQILRKLLSRSLGLGTDSLRFYDFPAIPDIPQFKADLKAALDCCAADTADTSDIVAEAAKAFSLNIAVSEAVKTAMPLQAAAHGQDCSLSL